MREILHARQNISEQELEDKALGQFGGLLTPEIELVEICARTYADLQAGEWVWRNASVEQELTQARARVIQLGERLGRELLRVLGRGAVADLIDLAEDDRPRDRRARPEARRGQEREDGASAHFSPFFLLPFGFAGWFFFNSSFKER